MTPNTARTSPRRQRLATELARAAAVAASALALGLSSAALAAPPGHGPGPAGGAFMRLSPGMSRPAPRPHPQGPAAHRPPPRPQFAGHRPAPPPPPRHHHGGWSIVAPIAATTLVAGAIIASNSTEAASTRVVERVVEVPAPAPSGSVPVAPAAGAVPWYWCQSELAYYPTVRSCPLGWETVMGASAATPPAPPLP